MHFGSHEKRFDGEHEARPDARVRRASRVEHFSTSGRLRTSAWTQGRSVPSLCRRARSPQEFCRVTLGAFPSPQHPAELSPSSLRGSPNESRRKCPNQGTRLARRVNHSSSWRRYAAGAPVSPRLGVGLSVAVRRIRHPDSRSDGVSMPGDMWLDRLALGGRRRRSGILRRSRSGEHRPRVGGSPNGECVR